ncbi:radical SAM/SPASM domain-containing protein [Butyrivibrio sp. YAB3001]|uniref:radical SAM/SPASM domain-containing protein n=1 Tax=Butyrivibrio sp. YAB3001 TaxID=1520812 RepID=UPI0008F62670|nr:radical SAM protein [Butyrivibrio sp. YAB3001]SFC94468.1 radical SAM additional 4Fe4S-binding SPASM domain-containing protein [Butyrivibrio sp. YAB3001]
MIFTDLINGINRIKAETDGLYIYGAGFYGKDIFRVLQNHGIDIKGFITTNGKSDGLVLGKDVYPAKEIIENNVGVIIGVSDTYIDQVMEYLKEHNFNMNHVINGGRYITDTGGREDLRDSKALEISTIMGCSVNCHYCPQSLFLHTYFKDDKNRQRVMTIENFQTILDHTPDDCIIDFSGMTEPFNNKDCIKMIEMACDAGRKVYLFTTLAEVEESIVEKLITLPIYYMTLHVADKLGYAYIPTTEAYYRNVERVINAKKKDGTPFVDFINAQTDPDERVAKIVGDKYEIMRSVQNRAGNVKDETAQHRKELIRPDQKIKCCFCGDDLSNSVVLPDGTMLICNMDYGMKHVLGNLYEEDYDTVRSKGELQRVLRALKCEEQMDELLCRSCLLARIADD